MLRKFFYVARVLRKLRPAPVQMKREHLSLKLYLNDRSSDFICPHLINLDVSRPRARYNELQDTRRETEPALFGIQK